MHLGILKIKKIKANFSNKMSICKSVEKQNKKLHYFEDIIQPTAKFTPESKKSLFKMTGHCL